MTTQAEDLEHIRNRPAMYIGDTTRRGLHHLMAELVDNVIDQFLSERASTLSLRWNDHTLTISDDAGGLPFDVPHESDKTLATHYLSQLRLNSPTADGHTPHIHMNGGGAGLRVVTALASSCKVKSWRNGSDADAAARIDRSPSIPTSSVASPGSGDGHGSLSGASQSNSAISTNDSPSLTNDTRS